MNRKSALLVAASLLALAPPASANDYFFRSKALVSPPQPIEIAAKPNAIAGGSTSPAPSASARA